MQTTYYTTENFIRHRENVVDLTAYREKLEQARRAAPCADDTRDWTFIPLSFREEEPESPLPSRQERWAIGMDMLASCAIVVMALGFVLRIFVM